LTLLLDRVEAIESKGETIKGGVSLLAAVASDLLASIPGISFSVSNVMEEAKTLCLGMLDEHSSTKLQAVSREF